MPQYNLIARYLDDSSLLIEASNPKWKEAVLAKGKIKLENKELKVVLWDPAVDEGVRLKSVWIKKKSFPIPLWYLNEFEKQVNDFGLVLELDQRTSSHT